MIEPRKGRFRCRRMNPHERANRCFRFEQWTVVSRCKNKRRCLRESGEAHHCSIWCKQFCAWKRCCSHQICRSTTEVAPPCCICPARPGPAVGQGAHPALKIKQEHQRAEDASPRDGSEDPDLRLHNQTFCELTKGINLEMHLTEYHGSLATLHSWWIFNGSAFKNQVVPCWNETPSCGSSHHCAQQRTTLNAPCIELEPWSACFSSSNGRRTLLWYVNDKPSSSENESDSFTQKCHYISSTSCLHNIHFSTNSELHKSVTSHCPASGTLRQATRLTLTCSETESKILNLTDSVDVDPDVFTQLLEELCVSFIKENHAELDLVRHLKTNETFSALSVFFSWCLNLNQSCASLRLHWLQHRLSFFPVKSSNSGTKFKCTPEYKRTTNILPSNWKVAAEPKTHLFSRSTLGRNKCAFYLCQWLGLEICKQLYRSSG